MPADERIKVIFKRVYVKNDADWFGSGEFYFMASVDGSPVGDRSRIFDAHEGQWINLPAAQWSREVDVHAKTEVRTRFQGKDQDVIWDDNLGTVSHVLRPRWRQRTFFVETEFFLLEWVVELGVEGRFGRHPPDTVFACREHAGSLICTTVSGTSLTARMEVHPVRPVPPVLPTRPALPGSAVENKAGVVVAPADPINVVPNPSVIPVLDPPSAAPIGPHQPGDLDDATWANDRNCARIEFTFYRPDTLGFTDGDSRLEWTARPLAGGAVSFLGPARGLKVMVYGTSAGEVVLEVRFRGALFASYRVLVLEIKLVPCRFNILNGPTLATTPRATPANVLDHQKITNRFLRQMGLALVLNTDRTRSDGATAVLDSSGNIIDGIFRIRVTRGTTFQIDSTVVNLRATRLNHRTNVMNFAYVHSEQDPAVGGAASDFPNSTVAPAVGGVRPTVTDSGTPSTSWVSPSGVPLDPAAGTVTMTLINGIQRAGHPQLFAMFVCDTVGDPATVAGQQGYAKAIAHEFGHILNLGHRVEQPDATQPTGLSANGIFWDGLTHPPRENIMHFSGVQADSQDFDVIQTRAVHQSPLVVAAPALTPPGPGAGPPVRRRTPGPVEYVIVEGDWLSKIAQRHGMTWQELNNYDGGTGVPNKQRLRSGDPDLIYPGEVILVPGNA